MMSRLSPRRINSFRIDPGYLTGWVVEQYQIDLKEAAAASKDRMDSEIERTCIQQIPGDTHRNLRVHSQYSGQTFKHVLLPVCATDLQLRQQDLPSGRQRHHRQDRGRVLR